jgi:mRNA interferase MazF
VTEEGQVVLFAFPEAGQITGKFRPAVIIRALPNPHGDWLVCMISSQLRHEIPEMDEVVRDTDSDFPETGLRMTSLIRVARVAVVSRGELEGAIGQLSEERLRRIRRRLARWIDSEASDNVTGK